MILSKKNSRKIVVGYDEYNWFISANNRGIIVLIAEHAEEKGQKLEVYIESDINEFWVEFPYVSKLKFNIIKQKEVSIIIAEAIEQGWKLSQNGIPLIFDWIENKLVMRK